MVKHLPLLEAFQLAARLHTGQVDQAGKPYLEHLVRVFLRVQSTGGDADQQIASLLHDAIEDGKITASELLDAGLSVGAVSLIETLTRWQGEPYEDYVLRIAKNARARLVKCADLEDNKDPGRLSLLSVSTAKRLEKRYAWALATLGNPVQSHAPSP